MTRALKTTVSPAKSAKANPDRKGQERDIMARVEAAKAQSTGIDITDVPDEVLLAFLRRDA